MFYYGKSGSYLNLEVIVLYLRPKKKEGRKYLQAWEHRNGKDRYIQHLGTIEIIVDNTRVIKELKKIHPEVYKQLKDIVGQFRAASS